MAKIDVAFTHDAVINGEDRNLYVESITANEQTLYASEAQYDRGSGDAAFDGADVISGQTAMPWNGALRFNLRASPGVDVIVRAKSTLAGGVPPVMTVRVDGVTIGSRMIKNSDFYPYDSNAYVDFGFKAPFVSSTAKIDVVFNNDAAINGEDRNLYVESIKVRNQTLTASQAKYDRGLGNAAFDGVDVIAGQAAMAWNGALRFSLGTPPQKLWSFGQGPIWQAMSGR